MIHNNFQYAAHTPRELDFKIEQPCCDLSCPQSKHCKVDWNVLMHMTNGNIKVGMINIAKGLHKNDCKIETVITDYDLDILCLIETNLALNVNTPLIQGFSSVLLLQKSQI